MKKFRNMFTSFLIVAMLLVPLSQAVVAAPNTQLLNSAFDNSRTIASTTELGGQEMMETEGALLFFPFLINLGLGVLGGAASYVGVSAATGSFSWWGFGMSIAGGAAGGGVAGFFINKALSSAAGGLVGGFAGNSDAFFKKWRLRL